MQTFVEFQRIAIGIIVITLSVGCAGAIEEEALGSPAPAAAELPIPSATPPVPPTSDPVDNKPTNEDAIRFLKAATFGPTEDSMVELVDIGYAEWIKTQMQIPFTSIVDRSWTALDPDTRWRGEQHIPINEFYRNAILGQDQLRMRATFSLSQIFVVSGEGNDLIKSDGEGLARYMDILQEGAFGNYRDLLGEITYSPIMGEYLTYAGNRKADLAMGSAPDENYAREIMQLFTIGLFQLNNDGSFKLDSRGNRMETYSNDDVSELAKVFTGLWWDGLPFGTGRSNRTQQSSISRMVMHDEQNSPGEKLVLGQAIPAELSGDEAIGAALDILFDHPNVAPFVSKRLIQRTTTSNPSAEYINRVADAFNNGEYELDNGDSIGSGDRGDLSAVWAAILLDEEFIGIQSRDDQTFGKVREPVLRFTHWARFAGVPEVQWIDGRTMLDEFALLHQQSDRLGQRAFSSPSVFNFFRPGYSAPGSATAEFDLVAPELQITDQNSVVSYANFMRHLTFRDPGDGSRAGPYAFVGEYSDEIEIADEPAALVDRLDLLLTGGTLDEENRVRIGLAIESVPLPDDDREAALRNRVQLAVLLTLVTPEFLIQH